MRVMDGVAVRPIVIYCRTRRSLHRIKRVIRMSLFLSPVSLFDTAVTALFCIVSAITIIRRIEAICVYKNLHCFHYYPSLTADCNGQFEWIRYRCPAFGRSKG